MKSLNALPSHLCRLTLLSPMMMTYSFRHVHPWIIYFRPQRRKSSMDLPVGCGITSVVRVKGASSCRCQGVLTRHPQLQLCTLCVTWLWRQFPMEKRRYENMLYFRMLFWVKCIMDLSFNPNGKWRIGKYMLWECFVRYNKLNNMRIGWRYVWDVSDVQCNMTIIKWKRKLFPVIACRKFDEELAECKLCIEWWYRLKEWRDKN